MTKFINKLGNILKVFKTGKNRDYGSPKVESATPSPSSSEIKAPVNPNNKKESNPPKLRRIKKSKSMKSVSVTVSNLTNEFNQLKRSHGTCDILGNTDEREEIKCTSSLHRFPYLNRVNDCIFSYNTKLHQSTIWSKAVENIVEHSMRQPNKSFSSSSTQNDTESYEKYETSMRCTGDVDNIGLNESVENNGEIDSVGDTAMKNDQANHNQEEKLEKLKTRENLKCIQILNENKLNDHVPDEYSFVRADDKIGENNFNTNKSIENFRHVRKNEIRPEILTQTNINETKVFSREESNIPNSKPSSPKNQGDKTLIQKYASLTKFQRNQFDLKNNLLPDSNNEQVSPENLSRTTTEYEIVNLAQVDLFNEFKTTIAKMRNVLNVLEEKETTKNIDDQICPNPNDENGNISTQTATMTYNQISTSTDGGISSPMKNEEVMVQFSSEHTSKGETKTRSIAVNSSCFNNVKPTEKVRKKKRYRRVRICRKKKLKKKTVDAASPLPKDSMQPEKPQYQKCVVYHITEHKDAVDRCVGTPMNSSKKENVVLNNTFSALHFGPIHEFPVLLNKHENEEIKKKEMRQKEPPFIDSSRYDKQIPDKLNDGSSISKTHSNDNTLKSSGSLNTSTTANWLVFEPTPPLVVKDKASTSSEITFDKDSPSTQEMVSKLLDDEFRTSGLKGKISSDTMNMIKDQFCDKLNGLSSKDIPDIMITVCVPLKDIVSKIKVTKTSEDTPLTLKTSRHSKSRLPKIPTFNVAIQADSSSFYLNDNLQTIPEKMARKAAVDIYQQNKILRENNQYRKFSTFKKIFGNKATSCSYINPFGDLAPKVSKIFFSDHSTSAPEFGSKKLPRDQENVNGGKLASTTNSPKANKYDNSGSPKTESFFLNLPTNRYRKRREQISRIFEGTDSSDRQYSGEPKLLFHVHDSSFYSSSKTDGKVSHLENKTHENCHVSQATYYPVQHIVSRAEINVGPKCKSFCELKHKHAYEQGKISSGTKLIEKSNKSYNKRFKSVKVSTSDDKLVQESGTQCEITVLKSNSYIDSKRGVGSQMEDELIRKCIDDFSISSFQQVRFEEDDSKKNDENMKEGSEYIPDNKPERKTIEKNHEKTDTTSNDRSSVLSLFAEMEPKVDRNNESLEERINIQKNHGKEKCSDNHRQMKSSELFCQISSGSNIAQQNQPLDDWITPSDVLLLKKLNREQSQGVHNMQQNVSCNTFPLEKIEAVDPGKEKNPRNEKLLPKLMKDIAEICNSSFIKSRDCIVELTLYNLIKEIIVEHCSHLSEQSKQKIESILANFVRESKMKSDPINIQVVESAIEKLVKDKKQEIIEKPRSQEREKRKNKHRRSVDTDHKHHSRSKSRRHKHGHTSQKAETNFDEEKLERCCSLYGLEGHNKYKCITGRYKSRDRSRFHTLEGKREYDHLVKRLTELEEVTKQLSAVAKNKQILHSSNVNKPPFFAFNQVYSVLTDNNQKRSQSKRRMKYSVSEHKDLVKKPLEVTEVDNSIIPIPKNFPKLPVTKIVINLSNLKLLTRNCVSMISTSTKEPIIITDSTEQKQRLINKVIAYEIDGKGKTTAGFQEIITKNQKTSRKSKTRLSNKKSFTITIHGNDVSKTSRPVKNLRPKKSKEFVRIKMMKKKHQMSSPSERSTIEDSCTIKWKNNAEISDIHRITKEFIKKEYQLKSDDLCSNIATDLLENKFTLNQILNQKGDLDLAYQRMSNFCMFRGLLRKDSS